MENKKSKRTFHPISKGLLKNPLGSKIRPISDGFEKVLKAGIVYFFKLLSPFPASFTCLTPSLVGALLRTMCATFFCE